MEAQARFYPLLQVGGRPAAPGGLLVELAMAAEMEVLIIAALGRGVLVATQEMVVTVERRGLVEAEEVAVRVERRLFASFSGRNMLPVAVAGELVFLVQEVQAVGEVEGLILALLLQAAGVAVTEQQGAMQVGLPPLAKAETADCMAGVAEVVATLTVVWLKTGVVGELAQSASSGPVVRGRSHQLERRTNNETIHTN